MEHEFDEEEYDDEVAYDDEEEECDDEEAFPAEEGELFLTEEEDAETVEADSEEQQATEKDLENKEVCTRCGYGGTLLWCDYCPEMYHIECAELLPLHVIPQGEWFCHRCGIKKSREDSDSNNSGEVTSSRRSNRLKAESRDDLLLTKTEVPEETIEADSDEQQAREKDSENTEVCTTCGVGGTLLCCEHCPGMYHIECAEPPPRRVFSRDDKWSCCRCRIKKSRENSDSDSSGEVASSIRLNQHEAESRDDLPLHNAPLQELLSDVLKQDSAWPFLRPLRKTKISDYYDIITNPMDFGTINYKLNMGEYKCDADLMADAVLVFENSNTYKNNDGEIYECGITLLKYFVNRCQELGLKLPEKLLEKYYYNYNLEPPALKKMRTK